MATPVISTDDYVAAHGRKPRGRGTWQFATKPDMAKAECEAKYGEAHDAHMAMNSECPWCGAARFTYYDTTYSAAVRQVISKLGPGPWFVQP